MKPRPHTKAHMEAGMRQRRAKRCLSPRYSALRTVEDRGGPWRTSHSALRQAFWPDVARRCWVSRSTETGPLRTRLRTRSFAVCGLRALERTA